MLQYSGLGDIIGQAVSSANLPIVVVAFVVAALVRICVGSATVAMTMAAGIIAAMPEIAGLSPLYPVSYTHEGGGGTGLGGAGLAGSIPVRPHIRRQGSEK